MRTKLCPLCKVVKTIEEFYWNQKQNRSLSYCKLCHKLYTSKYSKTIQGKKNNIQAFQRYKKLHRPRRWASKTYYKHLKMGHKFEFSVKELMEKAEHHSCCEFCHKIIRWNNTKISADSPSLENLYHLQNAKSLKDVAIICYECRITKQDKSIKEFLKYIQTILPQIKAFNQ